MNRFTLCAVVAPAIALVALHPASAQVLGRQPSYTERGLSAVPNADAMTLRIWAPGLNEGFVPQGLTFLDDAVFVATYRSEDPKQGRGPCRLYRIDPRSGAETGVLDLPPQCGHAGGLARGEARRLWVADTRMIFEIGLASRGDSAVGRVLKTITLAGDVKGSFATGTADALWLGTYGKQPGGRLYKFPFERLGTSPDVISAAEATAVVDLPTKAQGAAFDSAGRLWVTRSGAELGELLQIDTQTGAILQRFAMPHGIEDISFDPGGALWAVSEAGSKRWLAWSTFFPVIFRLDVSRLR